MIKNVQIDTNGFCGSKCWYCPVRYIPRPMTKVMSEESFRGILDELVGFETKPTIWLAAYNDILMDPLLKSRLSLLQQYGYSIPILSNGIGLYRSVETLHEYSNIITSFTIDLPAGNESDYTKHTGNYGLVFRTIIKGIETLYETAPEVYGSKINIHVNGVYDDEYARNQLKIDIPIGDTDKQKSQLQERFPYLLDRVRDCRPLCDRAGLLREFAIDNSQMPCRANWRLPIGATRANGCNGGDRLNSWVHISSTGGMFLCCQDYNQDTTYGNVKNKGIIAGFYSSEKEAAVEKALTGLCTKCQFSF